jgi:hypothetical protein
MICEIFGINIISFFSGRPGGVNNNLAWYVFVQVIRRIYFCCVDPYKIFDIWVCYQLFYVSSKKHKNR